MTVYNSGSNNPMYGRVGTLNPNYGRKASKETKLKMSKSHIGKCRDSNHSNWKGDTVGYESLHSYIERRLPKPELCPMCNDVSPYDIACITDVYDRDLSNWQWLCRRCHMKSDGRLDELLSKYNTEHDLSTRHIAKTSRLLRWLFGNSLKDQETKHKMSISAKRRWEKIKNG